MGIFSRKSEAKGSIHLLMPDGTEPSINSQQDVNDLFASWTITPANASKWRMEIADQDEWIRSSTDIFSLGLQNQEGGPSIYASSETYVSGLEGLNTEMSGRSILTELFTLVIWPYGLTKNALVLFHDDVTGIQSAGSTSADFGYRNALWIKNGKPRETGPIEIYLACKFSKDGHANRRAITFWYSLGANLESRFR
jgi:hypothetical protein